MEVILLAALTPLAFYLFPTFFASCLPAPDGSFDNTITLSEAFYREIDAHRIPVEREVMAALAHAPGALGFYVWIVWKSWVVNGRPAYIPIL